MQLRVSSRIIASFTAIMIFVAGLLFTGLWGIGAINTGLTNLTTTAIPLTHNSSALVAALLQSKVNLIDYQAEQKLSKLDDSEKRWLEQKNIALSHQSELISLSSNDKNLKPLMDELSELNNSIFTMSQQFIETHKQEVTNFEKGIKAKRDYSDLIDGLISKLSDVEKQGGGNQHENISQIDKIGDALNEAMGRTIPAAVAGAKAQIKSQFTQLDKSINSLSISGNAKAEEIVSSYEQLKKYSVGDDGALNSYTIALRAKKQNQEDFVKLDETFSAAREKLNSLSEEIEKIVAATHKNADTTVKQSRTILIVAGIAALILSAFIAFNVIGAISNPLKNIGSTIAKVTAGDLTQHFVGHNRDEFGELGNSMNTLVDNFRSIIGDLNNNSQRLAATAEQTSLASQNSFQNINHQKLQTDMIASAVVEMSATVDEVAKNAANTLREVENAYTKVTQGERVINENIHSISELSRDIALSADAIEKLNQRSNEIGGVLEVIGGIAEQTNLLALNAAIEAARAGEQGRGFAVVADEVRTLASRTHQSTADIQEMIKQLQLGAHQAVETMNHSRGQVQQRVESITSAGQVLASITSSVTMIRDMSFQIAAASEEQSSTTREQNKNILAIVEAADKTADAAKENQHASENLTKIVQQQLLTIKKFTI